MSRTLKNYVSRRVLELLVSGGPAESDVIKLASKLELRRSSDSKIGLSLSADTMSQFADCRNVHHYTNFKDQYLPDDVIDKVSMFERNRKSNIFFEFNQTKFTEDVLQYHAAAKAFPSCHKRVVVEFSSPNIAKPFHVGHLRSTIIGNYVANLHEWFGYDVIRLNYLGDWGTQFGLIKVGMNILNPSSEELSKRPLYTLYQAYVIANAEAEKDPCIMDQARKIFMNLENGDDTDVFDWKLYKEYTVAELMKTYARLGIKFDEYSWESDYKAKSIIHIIGLLKSFGQLNTDKEGRSVVTVKGKAIPLVKSDGTTLYLTRDIAAAIDREAKYKFHLMYYLADTSQHNHFQNLFHILGDLKCPWSEKLKHIRFGRIRGMSTRQGAAVFLDDILDEAHQLMVKQQQASPNTRVNLSEDLRTADILGVSAIIVADLIHKRMKDYTFDWNSAQSMTGNTGVRLQYTHCRLRSLSERSHVPVALMCDPKYLSEPAAVNLVYEISRFEEVLQKSFEELEASKLAEYLFTLCDAINKALIALQVSNAGILGEQRLLLFEEARATLYQGMKLMGLLPLNCM